MPTGAAVPTTTARRGLTGTRTHYPNSSKTRNHNAEGATYVLFVRESSFQHTNQTTKNDEPPWRNIIASPRFGFPQLGTSGSHNLWHWAAKTETTCDIGPPQPVTRDNRGVAPEKSKELNFMCAVVVRKGSDSRHALWRPQRRQSRVVCFVADEGISGPYFSDGKAEPVLTSVNQVVL